MAADLTLLYYTANRLSYHFAGAVRRALEAVTTAPIVVVSQSGTPSGDLNISADFANRIEAFLSVGPIAPSIAQVYRNVFLAATAAQTDYVAMCEDDSLYLAEHFAYRPPRDAFAYNENRWILSRKLAADGRRRVGEYFFNPRTQLAMGICSRALLIETLKERFEKHPDPPTDTNVAKNAGWGEMGRYEKNLKLTPRKLVRFKWTERPNLTINHSDSLMGRRQARPDMPSTDHLEPWGNATELWRRIVG
jgi:hypothetical protein